VDEETGQVTLVNLVAAHDVGKAINPMAVEGQIHGGVGMGIGWALFEDMVTEKGKILNPNFVEYMIPTSNELPNIKSILVEPYDPNGPFGAKGIGEPALNATAPAIANAIFDAVGVRIKSLPMTSEKVLAALKEEKA
jgi:CO/xanthine dehydrogenase Mo-binding subunit